jgi:hypothetical protein
MQTKRIVLRLFFLLLIIPIRFGAQAQLMNHYWSQSYNSISSLLSGAVVAGDAGPSSIYYNPATISELTKGTNISLAASFLTYNIYTAYNALGKGIHLQTSNFYVQPQFFSMSFNSPNRKLSIEIATFTRVRERLSFSYGNSIYGNFLDSPPLTERYTTSYNYRNDYDDSWLGIGGAYSFNERFSLGISLLFSASSLNYFHGLSAIFNPSVDSTENLPPDDSFLAAENEYFEKISFNNIRLVSKIGLSYQLESWSFGLNVTIPPLNIYTTSKQAERLQKEAYTTNGDEPVPDSYLIYDVRKDNDIKANFKLPFSVALGIIYELAHKNQRFYATIEYFAQVKPYKMVDVPVNDRITSKKVYDQLENKDWLSFAYAASPVLNVALGYQWRINNNLLLMMGVRTDFNNASRANLGELATYNVIKTTNYDIYYATGGIQFHIKQHLLVAGTQFSFGYNKDQEQIANFGDIGNVDYEKSLPLFGEKQNNMDTYYFAISVFLGATLNFEKKEKIPTD